MRCSDCGCELVWHEGAFSGWVHSNDAVENQRMAELCRLMAKPLHVQLVGGPLDGETLQAWKWNKDEKGRKGCADGLLLMSYSHGAGNPRHLCAYKCNEDRTLAHHVPE